MSRRLLSPILAFALALAAGHASAGRIHPDLEARLAQKAAGGLTPVIVELEERAQPATAAASAAARDRHGRGKAVVNALKDVADRTQGPVKADLAGESADDATNVQSLWVINALTLSASEKVIRKLAKRNDVREVRFDRAIAAPAKPKRVVQAKDDAPIIWNIEQIRAPQVWDLGYNGAGVVVGSFDTGVDGTHPDLAPNYRGNDAISWYDPYHQHSEPYDNNGHGTHTTGTMVASGDSSGFRISVAPGARWIAAKAWNDNDDGTASAFHLVFQWFLAPGGDSANAPDVVNSSWGLDPPSCDPEFVSDIAAFRAAGIVPVFAAGNSGPGAGTMLAPGSYASAFAVGATDDADDIAEFSSMGPSQCDGAIKPNVSAPGVGILSTLPGGITFELDGTSMATPHVSGAVAVLRSISPGLTVDEVESAITDGAIDFGAVGPDNEFGAGRLDLLQSASLVLGMPLVGIGATTPNAYEAGLVPGRFTLTRKGSTASDLVVAYTVAGTATPGSDYVALPGSVTFPAGATTATIVVTPIDDTEVELTETVIVNLTPNPGYIASPAQATVSIISDEIPPDLVVASLTAPPNGGAGSPLAISDTTRNQGAAGSVAAAPSATVFYLSNDYLLDASDVRLGSRAVPALAAGASSSGTTTVTLPASLAAGRYYILAKADGDDQLVETSEANNVTYTTVLIGADLQVSDLAAPATGGAGLALTITDTTRNAGSGTAIATTTSFYLSIDGTLDAGDVLLGSRAVPSLAPGATSTGSTTVTLPAATATGTYTLFARADSGDVVVETFENNNTRSAGLQVGPDLTMTSFTAPATAGIGTSFSVSDTTRNAGGGTAPASTTSFYLSANGTLDASDILLGSRAVPSLAPGASSSGSATLTIPAATPGGSYFLIAAADGGNAIVETSETNNIVNRGITVGSDLHILTFSAPTDAGAGLAITLTDTTRNQGAGTAAASTTSFYFSLDATLDAGDLLLGSRAVPALAGGATSSGSVTVTIPAGTATGTYYVIARADSGDVVSEAVEGNNTSYRTLRIGPDLQVSALTAPAAAGAGSSITVSVTTVNAGAGTAAASSTRIYLSTDWLLDAGDTVLASRAVPALGAGASDVGSVTVTIPAGTPGGTYYLIAVADGDGVVAETQENNNTFNRSLLIGPDLTLTALTVPATAGAGLAITVSDTTRNNGGGTAPASTTSYYLSTDSTLDVGDTLLGSRAVASLVAGAQDTGSVTLTIPAGTPTGTYTLIARADALDVVPETYENNNTTGRSISIGPDLQMQSLNIPASAGAGATVSISDSVRNAGGGAAAASTTRYYLSIDALPGGGDVLLGSRPVPALAPGATDSATLTVTIPAGTVGGSYYVVAVADDDGVVPETIETNNFTNRSILIGTDLVVSSFTGPTSGGAGLVLTLTDTTRNQGAGTSPPTTTGYYLSVNSTLDAGDTLLGSRAVAALASGASDTGSVSVTLPAGLTVGTYYLIARADSGDVAGEVNESNNTSTRTISVGPDLTIASLTAPTAAGPGSVITVTESTQNLGGGTAPASTTYYYLSADWQYSGDDVLLGTRAVPALAPGATSTASVTLTIPAATPGGTRYVIAVADGDATIVETVEVNNATYRSILIGADLQVASLIVPAIGGAGLALTITDTTRNAGGGAAAASTTSYYLSADFTLDGSDVLLGSRAVAALAPGASDTGSVTVTIPAGTATGTYTVFARADSEGAISETYENNNTSSSTLKVGPDLSVASLSAPISASAGAAFAVTETTRNAGGGGAGVSTTRYLLSANGLPDAGDIVLGMRSVPALGPGTTDTATVTLTVPPGTANGSYYLIAVSDADGTVAETVETNNFANRGFTVGP